MVIVRKGFQRRVNAVGGGRRDFERQLDGPAELMGHVVKVGISAGAGHDYRHRPPVPMPREALVVVDVGGQHQVG